MENWSETIKFLLKWKGVTANDVANGAKIANSTISNLINSDKTSPNSSTISKLSNYFEIPINHFSPEGISNYLDNSHPEPEKVMQKLKKFEEEINSLNKGLNEIKENNKEILAVTTRSFAKMDLILETVLNLLELYNLKKENDK